MVRPFLIIFLILKCIKCDREEIPNYLKFPFNTKIKSYSKTPLAEEYNETNFINDFLNNTIYINISMGTPQQNIKMMLDQEEKCFLVERDEKIMKYNNEHINNINYTHVTPYIKNASSTAVKTYYDFSKEDKIIYEMDEMFYLYKDSDIKNISVKNSSTLLRLLYRNYKNEEEIVYGKIGLNMNNHEDVLCSQFFYSLNIKYILNYFNYFFDFYSDFHGYFFFGPEPHLFRPKPNINTESQYIRLNTALSKGGYNNWTVLFNKIMITDKLENITYNLNDKAIQFDFNLGLIIGTSEYQNFIEKNYFNNLISEKICNKTLVEYSFDNNNVNHYYIYKCNRIFMNGDNFDKEKYRPYINYFELFPDFIYSMLIWSIISI